MVFWFLIEKRTRRLAQSVLRLGFQGKRTRNCYGKFHQKFMDVILLWKKTKTYFGLSIIKNFINKKWGYYEPFLISEVLNIFRFRVVFEQTLVLRFHCGSHLLKKSGDWKIDTFTSTYIHTLSVWEKCSGSWKLHSSNFLMIDTSMVGIIENMTPFGKINVCFLLQFTYLWNCWLGAVSPAIDFFYPIAT